MTSLHEVMGEAMFSRLSEFSMKYGGKAVDKNAAGIEIPLGKVGISFGIVDRYAKEVSCSIDFDGGGFLFGLVFAAIEGMSNKKVFIYTGGAGVKGRNEWYLGLCMDFLESHMDAIVEFPPSWFLEASNLERKNTENIFPDIAEREFAEKMELWNKWLGELI